MNDNDIKMLLCLPKRVINPGARIKDQRGSRQLNYDIEGAEGQTFRLFIRQNLRIDTSFSCGLLFISPSGESLTLTRYNGSDHDHSNPLDASEKLLMTPHIHVATERYLAASRKAEHFAEATDRYIDLIGAVRALVNDCHIDGVDFELLKRFSS